MPGYVVITGSSSGIGRATALLLDRSGFEVFAGVRSDEEAESIKADASARLRPLRIDVSDPESVAAAAAEVGAVVGAAGLTGLVNNAGVSALGPLEQLSLERVRSVFDVNVFGVLAVTQALAPLVRRGHGRIVNISSVGAWMSMPYISPVSASKAAVESFSDSLRMEMAGTGIKVIAVEPGSIHTPGSEGMGSAVESTIDDLSDDGRRIYETRFRKFVKAMSEMELNGSPPDVVAEAVRRALTDRSPRTRYPAGEKARTLSWLGRLLPNPALDRLRGRLFGG